MPNKVDLTFWAWITVQNFIKIESKLQP